MALVVIGLLTTAAASAYRPVQGMIQAQQAGRFMAGVKQALVAFTIVHHRLPCADTNGDGFEGAGGGCGTTGGFQTGHVPYATLDIPMSGAPGADVLSASIVYGVYRNTNAVVDADLVIAKERTGNQIGDLPGYDDLGDFRKALVNASNATVNGLFVYMTGVGRNKNCTTVKHHVAFVLASPGYEDADGDGNALDDINAGLSLTGSGTHCFASPDQRRSAVYDDGTLAMSFGMLAGMLRAVSH